MKKQISWLVAALVTGAFLTACGKQEAAPVAAKPVVLAKIVVGLDDNFPPMGFRDAKNTLVGFDIDLAREAAKRLGAEVEFKPIDWNAKEAELEWLDDYREAQGTDSLHHAVSGKPPDYCCYRAIRN